MGEFLTHIIQADRILDRIESRRIVEGIRNNIRLFRLGSQGPDIFYSQALFPRKEKDSLVKIADLLHEYRTGSFLADGFRQLAPVSWSDSWMQLAAYLCGAVCHYCADRALHPYIQAVSENWIWTIDGLPDKTTHMEVEAMLDVILWREAGYGSANRARTVTMCPNSKPWPESIVNFWVTGLFETYHIHVTEKMLANVAKDFAKGHRFLYDPRGIKKQFIYWMDGLTGDAFHLAKMPYPVKEKAGIDWKNTKRRTWIQPELPRVKRNESVDLLLEKAVNEAVNAINGLFAVLLRGEGRFEEWLPDKSYHTNLPCEEYMPHNCHTIDE